MRRLFFLAAAGLFLCSRTSLTAPRNAGKRPADSADTEVRPFRIKIPDSTLKDLKDRLARTRWPDQIPDSGWEYGADLGFVRNLVDYWRTKYNWREQERKMNKLPQFTTKIDGLDIHFVHVKSSNPNALPLLLVHGWPGSFYEFYKVIEPLAYPESPADSFHLVIPSLPGFGFSSHPKERGWSSQRMAEVFAKLMARLGYSRYGAQGGDWGSGIARWLASADSAHCIGAHSNFPGAGRPAEDPMRGVTPQEIERMEQRRKELADHYGYSSIQSTRPLTLGFALNDSPAGIAAWIIDKFWAWSDHRGNLENSFSRDELLTNVMIYWVTQSMPPSTRIYYESSHPQPRPSTMTPFQGGGRSSPIGFALFPKEINVPPRAWVERSLGRPLVHWTEFDRGGHFAALEVPNLLVQDIRAFFQKVR